MTQDPRTKGCADAHANVVRLCWPFYMTTQPVPVSRRQLMGHARHTVEIIEVEYENRTVYPIKVWRPIRLLLIEIAVHDDVTGLAAALTKLLEVFDECGKLDDYPEIDRRLIAFREELRGIVGSYNLVAG